MKRVVFNQKGGVGKTSISCNLASSFAALGRKTLVVDLDAQANASSYLLGDRLQSCEATVSDFFASTLSFRLFKDSLLNTICPSPYENLFVIPADDALKELQPKLEGRYKIFKLAEAIEATAEKLGFEEVIFDTPPALNFYSMSALMAVDAVLIPFDCDAFSADAIAKVREAVEEVVEDHRPNLILEGIIINHFMATARLPTELIEKLESENLPILKPYLSSSVVKSESHSAGVPLPFFKKSHKLTKEFLALASMLSPKPSKTGKKAKKKGATRSRRNRKDQAPSKQASL